LDITELTALVRSRLASGQLPRPCQRPKIFAGSGDGGTCACCSQQITARQVQYDVECLSSERETQLFSMHLQCFNVWAAELSLGS